MRDDKQFKRVLVVDDEVVITMMLARKLSKMGNEYIVDIATNCDEALAKIRQESYALVISDYKMPGLSGLDLVRAIHKLSPNTKTVLITAYPTGSLRETLNYMGLDGYLDGYLEKPCTMEQIQEVVERALGCAKQVKRDGQIENDPYRSGERTVPPAVREHLEELRLSTEARCILLLSSSGYPVEIVGHVGDLDISDVLASATTDFTSIYQEGIEYDFYLHNLNGELLLAVVLDANSKAGMVRFYTKPAAAQLIPLLKDKVSTTELVKNSEIEKG